MLPVNKSLTRFRFLPNRGLHRANLIDNPPIGLWPPMLVEGKDRRPPQIAHVQVAIRGDQFVVPTSRHGDDLALRIDDNGMPEQLIAVLDPGLGRGNGETGILVASRLDRQMRVKNPQMM